MSQAKTYIDKSRYKVYSVEGEFDDGFVNCFRTLMQTSHYIDIVYYAFCKRTGIGCNVSAGEYAVFNEDGRHCFSTSKLPNGFEELQVSNSDTATCANCDSEKSAASFFCPHCGYRG